MSLLYIHIRVNLSSLCFESFSSFIKYNVSIVLSFICHNSYYHLVGSSWLLELLDRWWNQLGRVDGGISLEESMVSSWKGLESSGIVSSKNVGRQQQASQMVLMSDESRQLMVCCSNWVPLASTFDVSISFIWRILVKKSFGRVLLKFIIGGIILIRWPVGN